MIYILAFLSIMGISTSSVWMMWILMELMTFIFIPWFLPESSRLCFYKMFYYYIIQSLASMMFLLTSIWMTMMNEFLFSLIMTFSLWLKIGIYPYFSWMSYIIESMPWSKYISLLTWMKVIPLSLTLITQSSFFLSWLLSLGNLVGLKSYSLFSIRQLMLLSSVSHLSWMTIGLMMEKSFLFLYFLIYFSSMICLQNMFKIYCINTLKSLLLIKSFPLWLLIFSISGVPPFPMFFFKLWVSKMMVISGNWLELLFILIFSIFPIYIYLMIIIVMIMMKKSLNYSAISCRLTYNVVNPVYIIFMVFNLILLVL